MAKDRILEILTAHDKRFDGIDKRFDGVDKHLKEIGGILSTHEFRLMNIEERMATKDDLVVFRNDILNGLDKQMVILQRLDQERVVTNHRLDRLEAKVGVDEA